MCLVIGCLGRKGTDEITDVHYGLVIYLPAFDTLLEPSPRTKAALAVLRNETHLISIRQTASLAASSGVQKEAMSAKKIREQLTGFGQRLQSSMTPEEITKVEAILKEHLWGVEIQDDDGKGAVFFQTDLDRGEEDELYVDRQPLGEHFQVQDVADVLKNTDRKILDKVLSHLEDNPVQEGERTRVCSEVIELLKRNTLENYGMIHKVFLKWASAQELDLFPELLNNSDPNGWINWAVLQAMLDMDQSKAISYLSRTPVIAAKNYLPHLLRDRPETARMVCLEILDVEDMDARISAIRGLRDVGLKQDIARIQQAENNVPEDRQRSVQTAVKVAINAIEGRG